MTATLRSIYHDDGDRVGELGFWWLMSNGRKVTLRAALCTCQGAQRECDIMYTQSPSIHCEHCGQVMDTKPLLGLTEEGEWIDRDSGKKFTVDTRDTTQKEDAPSQSAPSQVSSW